jgi:GNAT superfamily N-acetyltransferase
MPARPAQESDVPEILSLIKELADYERAAGEVAATEDDLRRHLFGPRPAASVLMAEDAEGAVVGFALWFPTFSTWLGRPGIWLEDLFVRPDRRGEGFGMALLAELRTMTEGRLEWAVLDWNEPSIRFYESLGARPVAGWTRYRWV